MSGDTILVRLEAVGQRRFRRDMKVSSRAVTGLTKAHVRASKASKRHGQANKKLSSGLKVLGMVAGRAAGPQGVGMLAQALQSATVAAAALTAAVGGLTAALGTLESAAAKSLRAVADAAGLAANRLRELAGLLWSAISASTVRGATVALAGMVPVLDRIRAAVRGVAAAFAAVGTSMSGRMGAFGEVLGGTGPAVPGLLPATPAPVGTMAGPGGNDPKNRMGLIPPGALPFAALVPAGLGEIHETAIPQFSEGLGDSSQILGESLGGIYKEIGSAINAVVTELERFGLVTPTILALAAAFGVWKLALFGASVMNTVMAATTVTATAATASATIAQEALNRTMRANVIGLIVTALAALVMGVIYAYNKFEWFRNVVNGAWGILKSIGTWIAENWKLVIVSLLAGPVGTAVFLIVKHFGTIVRFVKELPGKLRGLLEGMWDGLLNGAKVAFNGIAGLWNNTVGKLSFSIPGWIPVLGGKTFSMPTIPTFDLDGGKAAGGGKNAAVAGPYLSERGTHIPGAPRADDFSKAGRNVLMGGAVEKALGGSIPGGPPFNDRVPSLLTPGEHVWTRGEVRAAGGHRAVQELRRNVGRGTGTSSAAGPTYVSVEAPVQVRIGEGVLADAMANVHLKVQAGIPT